MGATGPQGLRGEIGPAGPTGPIGLLGPRRAREIGPAPLARLGTLVLRPSGTSVLLDLPVVWTAGPQDLLALKDRLG